MKEFISNQTINGTFGEMWFDDDYLGEVESCKANVDLTYSDVAMVGKLMAGKKLTKMEGKGSFKLHHVRSNIAKKASDAVKKGKTPSYKIISKLDDPDAIGAERIVLYRCKVDSLPLADWENGKLTEESYNFTFEDWDFLDYIEA
jgi:hypothetical protein